MSLSHKQNTQLLDIKLKFLNEKNINTRMKLLKELNMKMKSLNENRNID